MTRWITIPAKTMIWLVGLITVLLMAIMLAVGWLLFTEPGGRWVLEQVPGLEVTAFEGELAGTWQAESVTYEDGDTRAHIEAVSMAWRPGCLTRMTVCLDRLRTGDIHVSLPDEDDEDIELEELRDGPIELPNVSLPIRIQVGELTLGPLHLNDEQLLQRVSLRARMAGSELDLQQLEVRRQDLDARMAGNVRMKGDWPLAAALEVDYQLPDMEPLSLNGRFRGSAAELGVQISTSSPWALELGGTVEPLAQDMPVDLTLTMDEFLFSEELPETLTLEDILIHLHGNLDDGWSLSADAGVATEPSMSLALQAEADLESAQIARFEIRDNDERFVRLDETQVQWADQLQVEGGLTWRHFPWQRLMPDLEVPPVALETMDLQFELAEEDWLADLQANLATPEGPLSLHVPAEGDFSRARIRGMNAVTEQGRIGGDADVAFADNLEWMLDLDVDGINPGLWVAELPGELRGHIRSEGVLRDELPDGNADVELDGQLRGESFSARVDGDLNGEEWLLRTLDVRLGENRVDASGSGSLEDVSELRLAVALEQMEQLWPGLGGTFGGNLYGRNLLSEPSGELEFSGQDLAWEPLDLSLESLSLGGNLQPGYAGELGLALSQLKVDEQTLDEAEITLGGDPDRHELAIALKHELAELDLALAGGFDLDAMIWDGQLARGRIEGAGQDWQIDEPAPLYIDPEERVDLGAHCWRWEDASLCMEDQRLFPEQRIRMALSDLPVEAFDEFMPPDFEWQETLDAYVNLDIDESGPSGQAWVDAGDGVFRFREEIDPDDLDAQDDPDADGDSRWYELSYDELRLGARFSDDQADLGFDLRGPDLGRAAVGLRIDTSDEDYPLTGRMRLDTLDLALIRPYAGLQTLEGQINGEATIGGKLMHPDVHGELTLSNGRLIDPMIPLPVDNLDLTLSVAGNRAAIEGELQSGDDGKATISGEAEWIDHPRAEINIDGDRLPVTVEPFARLMVIPSVQITFDEDGLLVGGRVDIPSGQVRIRELPEGAIRVSDDEEIVGEEDVEDAFPLRMDLLVVIGQDRVSFDGFGVTGNLAGRLRLVDDMEARGEIELLDGRYEIYGQRLRIRRAEILFSGPLDQPYLDIEAVRETRDVVAGIRLTGPADDPQAEIFSEPSMPEQQALSYLLFGRPLRSEGDSNVVGEVALSMGLAQTAPMTRSLGERVGIRDLQLETEGYGDETSVVAAGYLTERLSLRYGVGLFEPVNRLAVRYELTQRLFVEAASGVANSLDLFYNRDFDFFFGGRD